MVHASVLCLILTLILTLTTNQGQAFNVDVQTLIEDVEFNISFVPTKVEALLEDQTIRLWMNYTCIWNRTSEAVLSALIDDTNIAIVTENARSSIQCVRPEDLDDRDGQNFTHSIVIKGQFLGRTTMHLTLSEHKRKSKPTGVLTVHQGYNISVVRPKDAINTIFIITIIIFIVILNIGFGCSIDLAVVKAILKKPIPPFIGFCCQFVLMPLLAFAISQAFGMKKEFGFGLLVVGTSPGGGASNVWTVLLDGDLNLSITMTLVSKVMALGMMPFWLFALGRFYMDFNKVRIPYPNIIFGLISIVLPCFIGIIIRRYRVNAAEFICKLVKPFAYAFVIFIIIFGSLTNPFIYILMGRYWYIIPAAMLLPYLGFLLGFLLSLILRQQKYRAVTIAIETGIQDTGIAILLLQATFPMPEGDLASSIAMSSALFTPFPLIIVRIIMTCHSMCWLKGKCVKCGGPVTADFPKMEQIEKEGTCEKDNFQKDSVNGSPELNHELKHITKTTENDQSRISQIDIVLPP